MATNRVNFQSMTPETISTLTDFNKAFYALRELSANFKATKETINAKIDAVKSERKTALDAGLSRDEVVEKYPLEDLLSELNKAEEDYNKDCKPHKEAQRNALALIDENIYYGYLMFVKSGSYNCQIKLELNKKSGKQTIEYGYSYSDMLKSFLDKLGCKKTDDAKALNKLTNLIIARTGGMVKASKGDDYLKAKSASQYKTLVMLALLQYLVVERGILVESADHTLALKQYND